MKTSLHKNRQRGMTLIEVMLSLVILVILCITTLVAVPYARYMVVTSAIEQSAIHAGSANIERQLHNYLNPVPLGGFNTDGWTNDVQTYVTINTESIYSDDYEYLVISNIVTYRDGKTVELITCRSLEVSSSER